MESQTKTILTVVILVALVLAGAMYYRSQQMIDAINAPKNDDFVCAQDAKICPDGSYVGRSGPDCLFATCPATSGDGSVSKNPRPDQISTEPVACSQEAKLCPDGSAVGRTGPNCAFAPCPTANPTY